MIRSVATSTQSNLSRENIPHEEGMQIGDICNLMLRHDSTSPFYSLLAILAIVLYSKRVREL
ncbi:hypothetical protein [Vibrio gallaecicus]|uniref:hypothetical protein n=1 Tax=Vibrio gallaecicus TaxID=552386 RepID=UPI0025B4A500|nr:hypothetical protein [Vibrio gallaecicus]MDN3614796.1 hypothetical protein [Vibrio gallaecicus]